MSTAEPLAAPSALPLGFLVAFKPRTAMRAILARDRREPVVALVVLCFLGLAFGGDEFRAAGAAADRFGWAIGLALTFGVLLLGSAIATGLFYAFAWFATHSGRIVGAEGTFRQVRTALAWGLTPFLWALFFRVPAMIAWPSASSVVYEPGPGRSIRIGDGNLVLNGVTTEAPFPQVAILTTLEIAVFIWYVVVASRTLAEAQKISAGKALANLLLALILPAAALIVAVVAAVVAKG